MEKRGMGREGEEEEDGPGGIILEVEGAGWRNGRESKDEKI